ncbi:hypothetical protein [Pseudomonas sp. MWU15-20650]|uniref:hypothetical protein n=1 Tax=Pseudomonas sp. MWU15-20650 TaxID=2933107 RepID=UPI00200DB079|nr:hypothetical protein [Pseudomonas sp. MWU15-20650]
MHITTVTQLPLRPAPVTTPPSKQSEAPITDSFTDTQTPNVLIRKRRSQEMPKRHINESHESYQNRLDSWAPDGRELGKPEPRTGWQIAGEIFLGILSGGPGVQMVRGPRPGLSPRLPPARTPPPSSAANSNVSGPVANSRSHAPKPSTVDPANIKPASQPARAPIQNNANNPVKSSPPDPVRRTSVGFSGGEAPTTINNNMRNIKQIEGELFTFQDMHEGHNRLNIFVHGKTLSVFEQLTGKPTQVVYNNRYHTPQQLLDSLRAKGVEPSNFHNVRLISCHSANGGKNSFASQFKELIDTPVTAYQGVVSAKPTIPNLEANFNQANTHGQDGRTALQNAYANNISFETVPRSIADDPIAWAVNSHVPVAI